MTYLNVENEWKYYINMSHSVNIVISQLIISYSFWRSYFTGRVWLPFPYRDREFDMETEVFCVNCGLRLDISISPLYC